MIPRVATWLGKIAVGSRVRATNHSRVRVAGRVPVLAAALAALLAAPSAIPATAALQRASSPAPAGPALADPRPNVVVFMVDDLPPLDGRLYPRLPNIQKIFVKGGVPFTDFHSETPLCCPARVGFLTGQHTWHHGVDKNAAWLFKPQMSLATQLQDIGYETMLVGKYLNGYSRLAPAVPPGWDHFSAKEGDDYYNYSFWNDGNPVPEKHGSKATDYLTDVMRGKILADLGAADPAKPIFAWFAVNAPHKPWLPAPRHVNDPRCDGIAPWNPPNYAEKDVSDKPLYVQSSPRYLASELRTRKGFDLGPVCRTLLSVDDLVMRIRNVLAAQNRLNNTIFVFTGDNGMNYGAHRLDSKLGPYETGIPFFISWPAQLGPGPGSVTDTVMNIDFAPTICELAGCTMGPYPNGQSDPDGQSFASLLVGRDTSMQRDSVVEDLPAAQQGVPSWFGARTTLASKLAAAGCTEAVRTGCRWHYVRYQDGTEELYDVSGGPCIAWHASMPGDPCELTNVASEPSNLPILTAMRYRLSVLVGTPAGSR